MKRGNFIRQRNGSSLLYRVLETYGADSPYVFAVMITNSKFHKAGMEKRLARVEDHEVIDPRNLASDCEPDAELSPNARWA